MYTLNSDKHQMFLNQRNKVSLNPFDDKRYILDPGIQTSATWIMREVPSMKRFVPLMIQTHGL